MIWRLMGALSAMALALALASWGWRTLTGAVQAPQAPPAVSAPAPAPAPQVFTADCGRPPAFAPAAVQNAHSVTQADWSVFGRPETGWAIYAPLVAHEVGVGCDPGSPAFAAALARWQTANRLGATGIMDAPTLDALRLVWLRRRPFVAASSNGACPPPPPPAQLAWASPEEGYRNKPIQLRAGALAAYRRLRTSARAAGVLDDPQLLTIFSGFRDPAQDARHCASDGGCGTIARANCSAHRTGAAIDVYLGAAPGYRPESADDPNRLYQSRTAAYRWLVANAGRFGFVNYPFEPWHWEWTGAGA